MADDIPTLTEEEIRALEAQDDIPTLSAEEMKTVGGAPPEAVSAPMTGLLHTAQGASGGWSDEGVGLLAGVAASGPGRWIREKTGILPLNPDGTDPLAPGGGGFSEARKGGTQSAREDLAEAKRQHKNVAIGADIVGSVISPINKIAAPAAGAARAGKVATSLTNEAKSAVREVAKQFAPVFKAGAVQGAIAGAGYSEADDLIGVGKDVTQGAAVGGVLAGLATGGMEVARGVRDTLKLRKLAKASAPDAAPSGAPELAPATAATARTSSPAKTQIDPQFARTEGGKTLRDPTLPASATNVPESATVNVKPPPKTEIGAQAKPEKWHDFIKGRMVPALKRNNNNAAAAMRELGQEWKAMQRSARRAPTEAEGNTVLNRTNSLDTELEAANDAARTIQNGPARKGVDPYAGTQALPPAPNKLPEQHYLYGPDQPMAKPPIAEVDLPSTKKDQLLDEEFAKKLEKDKDSLAQMIHAEIIEGPGGGKATPTQQKRLEKAGADIVEEVIEDPKLRKIYVGRAKQGREGLRKMVDDADAKNDAEYAKFTKVGRDVVDQTDYAATLDRAIKKANKSGMTDDVDLIKYIKNDFLQMVKENGSEALTLQQLRGWTTQIQGKAAGAIGALNGHPVALLKQRASALVTGAMYDTMSKAAGSDKTLKAAAEAIGAQNKKIHVYRSINDALEGREWKEKGEKGVVRKVVEGGVALGMAANGIIGLGSPGGIGPSLGRHAQRAATSRAIEAARKAKAGRLAVEDTKVRNVGVGVNRVGMPVARNVPPPEAEDLTVLTDDELRREWDRANKAKLSSSRFDRLEREINRRAGQ